MTGQQVDDLLRLVEAHDGAAPLFIGLDGRSGAGKSTLATALATALGASSSILVVEGDEFYAGGSGATWDARSPAENADRVIDWRSQYGALTALRTAGTATWRPFDWESPGWDADFAPMADPVSADLADLVLVEGVYSCRPELHDLLDLRVLLATPEEERRRRLHGREGDAYRNDWEARWGEAEDYYFCVVMPPARFDLVL